VKNFITLAPGDVVGVRSESLTMVKSGGPDKAKGGVRDVDESETKVIKIMKVVINALRLIAGV
jgi:hypothetical protein